jgi:hypothetical protein
MDIYGIKAIKHYLNSIMTFFIHMPKYLMYLKMTNSTQK